MSFEDNQMHAGTTGTGEFDMLLKEVLQPIANPEHDAGLREKITLRLLLAQIESEQQIALPVARVVPGELFAVRSSQGRSTTSTLTALALHAAAILLIAFVMAPRLRMGTAAKTPETLTRVETPPIAPRDHRLGGGGGQRGPAQVSKGAPPKLAPQQLLAPSVPPVAQPKIAVVPTINVQPNLKMASDLPNVGAASAPNVGVSMGSGEGSGLGSGLGNGLGPGSGGNAGGGVRQVGGGVSAPVVVYKVEPEFSEEARKAKLSGNVLMNLWVDARGNVVRARVLRGLGLGLDEKAIEAVKQFRFKPAMENGKPVAVEVNIEVDFQIM
jgi:protein TonB